MKIGLATPIDPRAFEQENELHLIGIVVHRNFPEPQLVDEIIQKGLARFGESAVWYYAETDKALGERLERNGAQAVALPLNPHWKYEDIRGSTMRWMRQRGGWIWTVVGRQVDDRKKMRDIELRRCDEVVVFLPESATSIWAEWKGDPILDTDHVHLIRRGAAALKRHRKGRKPAGA
jgi:hypothetical protein